MAVYSVWKDLIKPTIIAYIIACAIPGGIAGVYYLYSTYFRSPRHICRGSKLFGHTNPQYGDGYMCLNSKKALQVLYWSYFKDFTFYYYSTTAAIILSYFSESQ